MIRALTSYAWAVGAQGSSIRDSRLQAASLRRLWVMPLLALALFALAACGGEPEPTPTPTATPAPPATPTPAATATTGAIEQFPTAVAGQTATPLTDPALTAMPAPLTDTVSVPTVVDENNCPEDYDLDLAGYPDLFAKLGCAIAPSSNDAVAINEFGEGPDYTRFMLWFSTDLQIYVLFPDLTWQAYRDTWVEGQAELSCNPLNVPPTSPPLPRRGFGKLWCTVDGLQEKLGTIDREERLCQHTVVQRFEKGKLLACFEDATIRYFRLLDDGQWDMVMIR